MLRGLGSVAVAACLAEGCAPRASAQEPQNSLYPRFEIDASGTLLVLRETIRIDPHDTPRRGTEIDAEDVLGFSRTTFQPRATLRWRPWRRHELEAGILPAVRSAERTLGRTIVVGDTTFVEGAQISSTLRTSQAFLTYRFAFAARDAMQFGAALGVGALFFRTEIDALARATGGGIDTVRVQYSETAVATVPTVSVGAYGRFLFGNRWYLESELRSISLEVAGYDVHMVEGGVAGRYYFSRTVGAELGYSLGYYHESSDETARRRFFELDFRGKVDYVAHGFRGGIVILF